MLIFSDLALHEFLVSLFSPPILKWRDRSVNWLTLVDQRHIERLCSFKPVFFLEITSNQIFNILVHQLSKLLLLRRKIWNLVVLPRLVCLVTFENIRWHISAVEHMIHICVAHTVVPWPSGALPRSHRLRPFSLNFISFYLHLLDVFLWGLWKPAVMNPRLELPLGLLILNTLSSLLKQICWPDWGRPLLFRGCRGFGVVSHAPIVWLFCLRFVLIRVETLLKSVVGDHVDHGFVVSRLGLEVWVLNNSLGALILYRWGCSLLLGHLRWSVLVTARRFFIVSVVRDLYGVWLLALFFVQFVPFAILMILALHIIVNIELTARKLIWFFGGGWVDDPLPWFLKLFNELYQFEALLPPRLPYLPRIHHFEVIRVLVVLNITYFLKGSIKFHYFPCSPAQGSCKKPWVLQRDFYRDHKLSCIKALPAPLYHESCVVFTHLLFLLNF